MARILLVEDNELNRDMLSRRLAKRGYAVTMALDVAEGVALARSELPDLILMDIRLPYEDGYAALIKVRATRRLKDTIVAAVAANTSWKKNFEPSGTAVHDKEAKLETSAPSTCVIVSLRKKPLSPMKALPVLNIKPKPTAQNARLPKQ